MDLIKCMEFKNKTILVVGGASGIGQAVAMKMAQEGSNVVIADINQEAVDQTVGMITAQGGQVISFVGDATNGAYAQSLVEGTLQAFGSLHYLCNSAGKQTYGTVETTSLDTWKMTMSVNLDTIFLVSKFAIPAIRQAGGGAVVNISSVQGLQCQPNVSAYAASKGAVIALTRSMALDYAQENIRVNCICPGSIDTPLLREGAAQFGPLDEVIKEWGGHHPIGRIGKPTEIAEVAAFLFSAKAGFMLGQSVVVDGGLSIRIL